MAKVSKKKILVKVIDREIDDGKVRQCYAILDELVAQNHDEIAEAKIVLAWRYGLKPNADGQLILGKAKKASDLDRELHGYDFVILLNWNVWNRVDWTEEQMRALIDHELCHCTVALDKNDNPREDTQGRPVWRMRKHDIEEFREVVDRHGLWKQDLQEFAKAVLRKGRTPLFEQTRGPAEDEDSAEARKEMQRIADAGGEEAIVRQLTTYPKGMDEDRLIEMAGKFYSARTSLRALNRDYLAKVKPIIEILQAIAEKGKKSSISAAIELMVKHQDNAAECMWIMAAATELTKPTREGYACGFLDKAEKTQDTDSGGTVTIKVTGPDGKAVGKPVTLGTKAFEKAAKLAGSGAMRTAV